MSAARGIFASTSRESDSEFPRKVVSREHVFFSLTFPQDRNCEVCERTKIDGLLAVRRTGEAPLRAEKFGDLITADHKVLNEEGERRRDGEGHSDRR